MTDENTARQSLTRTAALLGVCIVLISLLHYLTSLEYHMLHSFFQRLYYIPIIFAALMLGLRGGAATALACTAAYAPHVIFQWGTMGMHFADQLSDMLMFNVVGAITGLLSDKERRMKDMYRDAYTRLQESFDKAQEASRMAAMGQLASAVAHEIRNPLNGIKGAQDILFETISPDREEYRFVDILKKETGRLEDIVTEFLDFARPRAPRRIQANVLHALRAVADLSTQHAAARGVSLVVDESCADLCTLMDPDQIRQALLNLVLNAIDACEPGGTVTLAARPEPGGAAIEVRDNGAGIAPAEQDRIFEPFHTTKSRGTGLGLAVCKSIARAHGGTISVQSAPGQGAAFIIYLPDPESSE
jgi:signal transduction histidine kinase